METIQFVLQEDAVLNDRPIYVYIDGERDAFDSPYRLSSEQIQTENTNAATLPTIEDAIKDFRSGCKEAFDYIYRYFKPKIRYIAHSKTKDLSEAEDLASEIDIQFIKCVNTYKFGSTKFNTFFYRCANNTVGMFYTHKTAKKRHTGMRLISLSEPNSDDNKTELIDTIEDTKQKTELQDVLFIQSLEDAVYPTLSTRERFIVKNIVNGIGLDDIARKLHISRRELTKCMSFLKTNRQLLDFLQKQKNSMS